MGIRDVKRKARRQLHERLSVRALYLVPVDAPPNALPGERFYADPVSVSVRVQTSFEALGDMSGTSYHYAERQEPTPKLVFMRSEVNTPMRGAVISVEPGEAYRVDSIMPSDDITVTAIVVKLLASELVGIPTPSVDPDLAETPQAAETYGAGENHITEDDAIGIVVALG